METKGPTLEAVARLFDGADANVSGKKVLHAKTTQTERGEAVHEEEI